MNGDGGRAVREATAGEGRPEPARFAALDGWRGICAIMIVFHHAPVLGLGMQSPFVAHAFLFVDFFFVLSGFVIAHACTRRLAERRDWRGFMAARLARVYPLHLFTLGLFVGFELLLLAARGPEAAFTGGNSVAALLHNLAMAHSLGVLDTLGWNYPSWSISAELVAYAAFATLLVLVPGRLAVLLVLAATVIVGLVVIGALVGHLDTHVRFGWLRCLAGFSLGALVRLALWPRAGTVGARLPRIVWTAAEIATVALCVLFVTATGLSPGSLLAPVVFALAVLVFAPERGAVSRLLLARPVRFLGLVSYSIYLTHAFVIARVVNAGTVAEGMLGRSLFTELGDGRKFFGPDLPTGLVALGLILCTTLTLSALTWRFVERPGQRLFRSRGREPAASVVLEAAPTASARKSEPIFGRPDA